MSAARPHSIPAHLQALMEKWSEPERWAWERISGGETANFNDRCGSRANPRESHGWSDQRLISPGFLKAILLQEPFRSAVPHQGIRIVGAWVKEVIDLEGAHIDREWWLDGSRIDAEVKLARAKCTELLSFENSIFYNFLNISSAILERQLNLTSIQCNSDLDMKSIRIGGNLSMSHARFAKKVTLESAEVDGSIEMENTKCTGPLNMRIVQVRGQISMRGEAIGEASFNSVTLWGAKVGGMLDMTAASFSGILDMKSINVAESVVFNGVTCEKQLYMQYAQMGRNLSILVLCDFDDPLFEDVEEFAKKDVRPRFLGEVSLRAASIKGLFILRGAYFERPLDLSQMTVGGHMFMSAFLGRDSQPMIDENKKITFPAEFQDITLVGAAIGGQLDLSGACFKGKVGMERLTVGTDVFMRAGACCMHTLILVFAKIGGSLHLYGSTLNSVNLTGTSILGEFHLGPLEGSHPLWERGAELTLTNAQAGSVQEHSAERAWPDRIDLSGFTYTKLGGLSAGVEGIIDFASRDATWYTEIWLKRNTTKSRQPYQQLATVLRSMGYSNKADDVLYAGQERYRLNLPWGWQRTGLSLLNITIGYGYGNRYFRSLIWVVLFTLVGAFVFSTTSTSVDYQIHEYFDISFCQLLPIIDLNKRFSEIFFGGWQEYYFYFHKTLGYILGGFVVAGLTGITKR